VIKTWEAWGGDWGRKTKGERGQKEVDEGRETGTRYVTHSTCTGYNGTFGKKNPVKKVH